ncbi:MAG TPA: hypothetical protein VN306_12320, partial [Mycobacterium sp.]|nr:hypothetical protein [Mycobacterium sp.]
TLRLVQLLQLSYPAPAPEGGQLSPIAAWSRWSRCRACVGFVAALARASDVVACALELQRAPLAPIRLRVGVHTDDVQLRDEGNYIGPTVNRTARLHVLPA